MTDDPQAVSGREPVADTEPPTAPAFERSISPIAGRWVRADGSKAIVLAALSPAAASSFWPQAA